jgi:hypothetical protein
MYVLEKDFPYAHQFVNDALAAGWTMGDVKKEKTIGTIERQITCMFGVLYDHDAWKAVAKTRGWDETKMKVRWHWLIDEILTGGGIELALKKIEND